MSDVTEPVDHLERAIDLLGKAGWQSTDDPGTAALAHATLALVEQQRIANLIALVGKTQHDAIPPVGSGIARADAIAAIREGLGLS